MSNDFLSNVSSRALQNPEVDSTGSALKPRLASRFEPLHAPVGPTVDQAPDTESLFEVEARDDTGFRSPLEQNRIRAVQKHPVPDEGSVSGVLPMPERRPEDLKHLFENRGKPAVPNPLSPMPATEHSEASSPTSPSTDAEGTGLPGSARKDENIQQSNISPVSAMVSPPAGLEQTIEIRTKIVEVEPPSVDTKKVTPASILPAELPSSEKKVVPQRIEVTPKEQQAQSAANVSKIIPSFDLPRLRPQSVTPEAQEQPPTIHVTIGRIEVKAAPPAASPKRRAPASPAMSLDEYLRRRPGGER